MKTTLLAIFGLLLAGVSYRGLQPVSAEIDTGPCIAGRTAAPFGFWNWPANSRVNVYLRTPDFSEADSSAVKTALQNWDAAAIENGSNVRFTFRGITTSARTSQGDLTLIRNAVYSKKERHLALLEAHSLRSDQVIDWALVVVDPSVRDANVLTNVMAHEIGHSLGLLDCYRCRRGSTAMGLLKSAGESNGIEGPTACDKITVSAAYQELKVHVRRAPGPATTSEVADEGSEPEVDDTPITVEPVKPAVSQKSPTVKTNGQASREPDRPLR